MLKIFTGILMFMAFQSFAQVQQPPNIIFILIDDQRYDFLSFLDHPWIETPHIDALAQNSIYFDNAFVTTSLCSPSRASILTGQYMHAHGVKDNDTELFAILPTFPKELQKAGYQTALIGKWHMGGNNDAPRPGFDHWVSFKGQGTYFDPQLNVDGEVVNEEGYITDILTDYAVDFIKKSKERNTPYFLHLSHKAIHGPFSPAPRHEGKYEGLEVPRPETFANTEKNYADKPLWVKRQRNSWHGVDRNFSGQNMDSFDHLFQLYSEAMLSVDESVGTIVETLKSLGELDNTIIIYFSDNGYMMGEHGLIDKRVMYEESIRVPLFVHWPAVIKEPARKEELVLNIDIGPTILELAGCLVPSTMHGISFARMIKGEPQIWRKDFLYEYFIDPAAVQTPTTYGLRTEKYSYMTYEGVWDIYELYDLEKDPQQKNNLLGDIVYGQTYGTFLQQVQRQDPQLWKIVEPLDNRLSELIIEKGGIR
jgi:N-acetylglucosamine-6-sulfatase